MQSVLHPNNFNPGCFKLMDEEVSIELSVLYPVC